MQPRQRSPPTDERGHMRTIAAAIAVAIFVFIVSIAPPAAIVSIAPPAAAARVLVARAVDVPTRLILPVVAYPAHRLRPQLPWHPVIPSPPVPSSTPRPKWVAPRYVPPPPPQPPTICPLTDTWQACTMAQSWNGALMLRITNCESGGDPFAQNRYSTAHGIFQLLSERSNDPLRQVQDAYALWLVQGYGAWDASRGCWG